MLAYYRAIEDAITLLPSSVPQHDCLFVVAHPPEEDCSEPFPFPAIFDRATVGSKQYSPRPMTPWEWAEISLKSDRNTRDAFVRFSLPRDQHFRSREICNPMHGQFSISGNTLHFCMVVRSCSVQRELPVWLPAFAGLLPRMRAALLSHYDSLVLGTYSQFTHFLGE
jgi:hypothetical protein